MKSGKNRNGDEKCHQRVRNFGVLVTGFFHQQKSGILVCLLNEIGFGINSTLYFFENGGIDFSGFLILADESEGDKIFNRRLIPGFDSVSHFNKIRIVAVGRGLKFFLVNQTV